MKDKLLAIDVGTSACKVALFSSDGQVCASATKHYGVSHPAPGWAEQDAQVWWSAVCAGVRETLENSATSPGDIAGIGVDGQSWSCVPVSASGEVLCETPIWMDTRAKTICARVRQEDTQGRLFALSGNPFEPSYTTPKILWLRENRPQVYRQTRWFMQSNAFIVYRLTGVASQDVSQGYGLHVFDMAQGRYDLSMCASLGIDVEQLPPLFACHAVVGCVSNEAACACGLLAGTPVVAGGLDAACGALGAGVLHPGEAQEQGGQAGGMSLCLDTPTADPALILSPHVVPKRWLLQGGTVGGGGSLRWLARELGEAEALREAQTGESRFAQLDTLAQTVAPGAEGLLFLPYLSGERSPIWNPDATGVYFGLDYSKTRAHFFRALLEGAAYALEHNLQTARCAGANAQVLYAVGGAAESQLWTQIKADVTGMEIRVPQAATATCLGAALLAGVGTGMYADFAQAVKATVRMTREHHPNPENHRVYEAYFPLYLEIYEQLKNVMGRSAALRAGNGIERTEKV